MWDDRFIHLKHGNVLPEFTSADLLIGFSSRGFLTRVLRLFEDRFNKTTRFKSFNFIGRCMRDGLEGIEDWLDLKEWDALFMIHRLGNDRLHSLWIRTHNGLPVVHSDQASNVASLCIPWVRIHPADQQAVLAEFRALGVDTEIVELLPDMFLTRQYAEA